MQGTPSRFWAFVLTLLAGVALSLPVVYAFFIRHDLGPFGSLIVWTTVSVAVFGILTVVLSVIRAFVKPALDTIDPRRRNGNL